MSDEPKKLTVEKLLERQINEVAENYICYAGDNDPYGTLAKMFLTAATKCMSYTIQSAA